MLTTPSDNCTKAWGSRSYNLYTGDARALTTPLYNISVSGTHPPPTTHSHPSTAGNSSYLARQNSAFYSSTPASDVKFGWYVCISSIWLGQSVFGWASPLQSTGGQDESNTPPSHPAWSMNA
jgi:hypothetical protein